MKVVPATSELERAAVFALRYDVIAGEQRNDADPFVDHARLAVIDPADATGVIFTAWADGVLAGTVRTNSLRDGPAEPYGTVLGLDKLPEHEQRVTSVTSRLVVHPRWRGTTLGVRLAQACYRHQQAAGVAWDYIVVRPEMVTFFARLGYTPVVAGGEFPGVGQLQPLRLNMDATRLRRMGSLLVAGLGSVEKERAGALTVPPPCGPSPRL